MYFTAWLLSPPTAQRPIDRNQRPPYRATSSDELVSTAAEVSSASQAPSGLSSNGKVTILRNSPGATARLDMGAQDGGKAVTVPGKARPTFDNLDAGREWEACRSARPIRC